MTRFTLLTTFTAGLLVGFVGPSVQTGRPSAHAAAAAAAPADGKAPEKAPPADDAAPPDEKTARAGVDALIRGFTDARKPATLGLIEEAIDQSIAFGAPAYNAGDRAACYRFYRKTAESLLAAFPDDATPPSASEPARKALADLRAAVDRGGRTKDADRGAWAMRLAFDKAHLSADLTAESARALVRMGDEYFRRSQFEEAQDAFESATAALAELDGRSADQVPPAVRFAPLALGQALFAQQKFPQATAALLTGLGSMPDWPGVKFDLRGMHTDPAEYEAAMDKLRAAVDAADKAADKADAPDKAAAAADGAGLHFLLGYQYWFTGKRDAAREQFDRAIKADPKHPGARRFLDAAEKQRRKDAQQV